jgi:DNA replicative helicase MCM subunit Mcm2 (Cdc46/Mcm family)
MKNNKYIFLSLIKSFCPTIYGHEIVKAGLILGLIGGSSKGLAPKTNFR